MADFAGRTVLVTGGSRGIGLMMAAGFAAAGANVLITSRDAVACEAAATQLSEVGSCQALPANISTAAGISEVVNWVKSQGSRLDVLVNNAGATWGAPIDEYPTAAFDKVLGLNVTSVFALTQGLLPALRANATATAPARVINIGSFAGLRVPEADNFAYSASKAAVHMLTQHLALALAPEHITVNAIAAGPFRTKMMEYLFDGGEAEAALLAQIPLGRPGEARDIAGAVMFLAGPSATWMTGAIIPLDGGAALA